MYKIIIWITRAGFGYRSPELVGVAMAITGAVFAWLLLARNKRKAGWKLSAFRLYQENVDKI